MKLTGEMFQEILARLTSDNSAGFHNKRLEPRVGVRAQGIITPWTLDETCTRAHRSPFEISRPVESVFSAAPHCNRGARFVLQLQRSQRAVLLVNYEVRYCKMLTSTLFCIGGKLVSINDDADETRAA